MTSPRAKGGTKTAEDRIERLAAYEAERRRAAEARIADRARRLAAERRRPRPDTAETEEPIG